MVFFVYSYVSFMKNTIDRHNELFEKLNNLNEQNKLPERGFVRDMYNILNTGYRPFTEKMYDATIKALKHMGAKFLDEVELVEAKAAAQDLIEKVNLVYNLVMDVDGDKKSYYRVNFSAIPFVESVKEQAEKRYSLSKKQMQALNKVYKKYQIRKEKKEKNSK